MYYTTKQFCNTHLVCIRFVNTPPSGVMFTGSVITITLTEEFVAICSLVRSLVHVTYSLAMSLATHINTNNSLRSKVVFNLCTYTVPVFIHMYILLCLIKQI